jgi:uncharacterized protein YjbI with pentapeptide repeats
MPEFGNVTLSGREIGQILWGQGDQIEVSLWEKIKDFFLTDTKPALIRQLVAEMKDPPEHNATLLEKFERIIKHARPEHQDQFKLVVRGPYATTRCTSLWVDIGSCRIGGHEWEGDGGSMHEALGAHAALCRLRSAVANENSRNGLCAFTTVEAVTDLIEASIKDLAAARPPENIPNIRQRYGDFMRRLQREIQQNATHPQASEAERALRSIDQALAADLPRVVVRDRLSTLKFEVMQANAPDPDGQAHTDYLQETQELRDKLDSSPRKGIPVLDLVTRDADFEGLSVAELLSVAQTAPKDIDLHGLPVRELLDQGADFGNVELQKLVNEGASLTGVCLRELIDAGLRGGGYQLFGERAPSGPEPRPMPIYALPDQPPLTCESILDKGFSVKDVPLKTLSREFDLRDLPVGRLIEAGVDLEGVSVGQLQRLEVGLEGIPVNTLAEKRVSFSALTLGDLIAMRMNLDGANLAKLLPDGLRAGGVKLKDLQNSTPELNGTAVLGFIDDKAELEGVSVKWLKERGASFEGVNYQTLRALKCDFSGLTPTDLKELGDRFLQATSVADLLNDKESGLDFGGCGLAVLLGLGATIQGVAMTQLLEKQIKPDGYSVADLVGQGVIFSDTPLSALSESKLNGLDSFADLHGAGISFIGMRPEELSKKLIGGRPPERGLMNFFKGRPSESNRLFKDVPVSTLMDAKLNLQDTSLAKLIELGVTIEGASVARLLAQGVKLNGSSFAELADKKADFSNTSIQRLEKSGLDLRKATFAELHARRVSFNMPLRDLLGKFPLVKRAPAGPSGVEPPTAISVADLLDAKVDLSNLPLTRLLQDAALGDVSVQRLITEDITLDGVSMADFKSASFSDVPFSMLQKTKLKGLDSFASLFKAGVSFVGMRPAELTSHLGDAKPTKSFFKDVSLSTLMEAQVQLEGSRLADLIDRGMPIQGVSVAELLAKSVTLEGLGFAQLQEADFSNTTIPQLHQSKLDLQDTRFAELLERG